MAKPAARNFLRDGLFTGVRVISQFITSEQDQRTNFTAKLHSLIGSFAILAGAEVFCKKQKV